eukprot:1158284-Pelagomonas_calceolata.AAC.1
MCVQVCTPHLLAGASCQTLSQLAFSVCQMDGSAEQSKQVVRMCAQEFARHDTTHTEKHLVCSLACLVESFCDLHGYQADDNTDDDYDNDNTDDDYDDDNTDDDYDDGDDDENNTDDDYDDNYDDDDDDDDDGCHR